MKVSTDMEKEKRDAVSETQELEQIIKDYFNRLAMISKALKIPGKGLDLETDIVEGGDSNDPKAM